MIFNLISLMPAMFSALEWGVVGRALNNNTIHLTHWQPRDFTHDAHQSVDDRPYGGGPGMVMRYEPLKAAIDTIRQTTQAGPIIHLSPDGSPVTHETIERLAKLPAITLLCSRYEGVDERLLATEIDESVSVGDCVVSGGELPAMMLIDAITRLLPGVLNDPQSAEQDSFTDDLLDCPHYTRPEKINGLDVPSVLLSGNHAAIQAWRHKEKLIKTWQKRPDLIKRRVLIDEDLDILRTCKGWTDE